MRRNRTTVTDTVFAQKFIEGQFACTHRCRYFPHNRYNLRLIALNGLIALIDEVLNVNIAATALWEVCGQELSIKRIHSKLAHKHLLELWEEHLSGPLVVGIVFKLGLQILAIELLGRLIHQVADGFGAFTFYESYEFTRLKLALSIVFTQQKERFCQVVVLADSGHKFKSSPNRVFKVLNG